MVCWAWLVIVGIVVIVRFLNFRCRTVQKKILRKL
uniref:Uncharacterized protein n=1 Tax=Anguilla anguilla TaxID=7936 RepID=A0A0E9RGA6_ANGAN